MQSLSIEDLRPEPASDLPEVNWGKTTPTPADLYTQYDKETAAATIRALQEIHDAEPTVTAALVEVSQSIPGVRIPAELLAYRVKSPQSLARKIADKTTKSGRSPREVARKLTDVVRYTLVVDEHDQLVPSASGAVDQLISRGWSVAEAEQSYVEGNPYKGLHLILRTPSGSHVELNVEIQVHSEATSAVKNRMHADYELERDGGVPRADRAAAHERMIQAWAEIPRPTGLDGLELGGHPVIEKTYPNPYIRTKTPREEGRT